MEVRSKTDDRKIIGALVCLFIGFAFIWNIAVNITDIYELQLDAETCERVRQLGLAPTANCFVTVPYRTAGLGPVGYMLLPEGNYIQVSPLAANRTNMSTEWSAAMKAQFVGALLFWVATLALLLSAFREKK